MLKRASARYLSSFLLLGLVACAPAVPSTPAGPAGTPASTVELTLVVSPTVLPQPTLETVTYVRVTYRDEANGFKLDYPEGWTVIPNTQIGSRGSQALLLSPGTIPEALSPGGSRVSITTYQWDPKNELASYVAHQRAAWDASGFITLAEREGELRDGRKEMDFIVQTPDKSQAAFLFTTNGDRYLQVAGEGDLALVLDIAHTLRPLDFNP